MLIVLILIGLTLVIATIDEPKDLAETKKKEIFYE